MPAYLGGINVFGYAVKVQHVPRASAQQLSNFFGISGSQLVWGGTRGRAFLISGVLVAADIYGLAAAEAVLNSYDDGIGRVLTDTWGRNWPFVISTGQYQPDAMGPRPLVGGGVALPYRLALFSLL